MSKKYSFSMKVYRSLDRGYKHRYLCGYDNDELYTLYVSALEWLRESIVERNFKDASAYNELVDHVKFIIDERSRNN